MFVDVIIDILADAYAEDEARATNNNANNNIIKYESAMFPIMEFLTSILKPEIFSKEIFVYFIEKLFSRFETFGFTYTFIEIVFYSFLRKYPELSDLIISTIIKNTNFESLKIDEHGQVSLNPVDIDMLISIIDLPCWNLNIDTGNIGDLSFEKYIEYLERACKINGLKGFIKMEASDERD
jgi:hypothetical protein